MDIRRASGQQQTVEPVEHHADIDLRTYRGDQNRQTTGRIDDRIQISLVDSVENPLIDRTHAAGNTDNRQMTGGHRARLKARIGGARRHRDPDIQTAWGRAPYRIAHRKVKP